MSATTMMRRSTVRLWRLLLATAIALACSRAGSASTAQAQSVAGPPRSLSSSDIVLVPGTVRVGEEMERAIIAALATDKNVVELQYFAITDVRDEDDWALISVIGLAQVHDGFTWSIDDGVWFGLVLLNREEPGTWAGATRTGPGYNELLAQAPETFISGDAKASLSSGPRSALDGGSYIFPWTQGYSMYYGDGGVHTNGFAFLVGGWKAVDMMSDGDTALGHAPNMLLAAAAGIVDYKCTDANNAAIKLGDFFYTHLKVSGSPEAGASFDQGDALGQLQTGTFGEEHQWCGWAAQPDDWFHVHWGFPDADLRVEDWSLSVSTQSWSGGCRTVAPGDGWILADGDNSLRISGTARVPFAQVTCDGGETQTVTADASGNYSFEVPHGWSGTVMPSLAGCTFDPLATAYNNVGADLGGQDYAAACSVTFRSVGAQDGWILESAENSGTGGELNTTDTQIRVGDDDLNRQYRSILSFNTDALPDDAAISSAVLKLKKTGRVGDNPFLTLGTMVLDIKSGGFSGNSALQLWDFHAAGSKNYAAKYTSANTTWISTAMGSRGLPHINRFGDTQLRLRFAADDNDNLLANYMLFASGNAITTSRPQLIITYTVP